MKKIILILVLCLSTIGLAGCGGSAPTKVTLDPKNGKAQMLEVGKDIEPGKYNIVDEDGNPIKIWVDVSAKGSTPYEMNRSCLQSSCGQWYNDRVKLSTVEVFEDDFIFTEVPQTITFEPIE